MSMLPHVARLLSRLSSCFDSDDDRRSVPRAAGPAPASVEPLEGRRLMTSITGMVTNNSEPVEGFAVWADSFNPSPNGHYDTGEPCSTTDASGSYYLTLSQGCYHIHLDVPSGYQQDSPTDPSYYSVSTDDGDQYGLNFTVSGGDLSAFFAPRGADGASADSASSTSGSGEPPSASQIVDSAASDGASVGDALGAATGDRDRPST